MEMLTTAAELGAAKVTAEVMPQRDLISQNEAYRRFGRRTVEHLKTRGLSPRRMGEAANSKLAYSLSELRSMTAALDTADMVISMRKPRTAAQ